jgi:hypothetical protein
MAEVDPNQEAALRRLRAAFGFSGDVGYWNCLNPVFGIQNSTMIS